VLRPQPRPGFRLRSTRATQGLRRHESRRREQFADSGSQLAEAQSFADDFELALHRGTEVFVCLVVGEGLVRGKAVDPPCSLLRVSQQLAGISVHRRGGVRR